MPYNPFNNKYYNFPFDKMIIRVGETIDIPRYILDKWINVFTELDSNSVYEANSIDYIFEPFCFTQHFDDLNSDYLFIYNITKIKSLTKHLAPITIDTKKLVVSVQYDSDAYDHLSNNTIFVVEFPSTTKDYLVVDGNHSLNTAILQKKPSVNYILFTPTKNNCFIQTIDYAMYIFYCKFNRLNKEILRLSEDDLYHYFDYLF